MRKPKVIYFDLGKVLVDFDWSGAVRAMAQQAKAGEGRIYERVTSGPRVTAYESGKIPTEDFFAYLKEEISFGPPAEELRRLWNDIFLPLAAHLRIAESLSRHYRLGLLSNTNASHAAHVDSAFHIFKLFSERVLSFETGYFKPQREVYELAAARFGAKGPEILFIDDLEVNVQAARAAGWQAIHYTKDRILLDELRAFGLKGL